MSLQTNHHFRRQSFHSRHAHQQPLTAMFDVYAPIGDTGRYRIVASVDEAKAYDISASARGRWTFKDLIGFGKASVFLFEEDGLFTTVVHDGWGEEIGRIEIPLSAGGFVRRRH